LQIVSIVGEPHPADVARQDPILAWIDHNVRGTPAPLLVS
jgi:hypothetical protein